MPSPAWEDLGVFLQLDDFATSVVITLRDSSTITVPAIFDDPYLNAQLGEYEADTSEPRLTCREADVLLVTRGDTALVDGKTYDILTAPQSDGVGMATIRMSLR